MATAAPPQSTTHGEEFDPDSYRMTIGEHLEDLRRRLIFALIGFGIILILCLVFGRQVVTVFVSPLINELQKRDLNPQVYTREMAESFTVFMRISVVAALVISAPWLVLQLWMFIAAGLYPRERKYITRYAPLSIGLLIAGVLFVYFLVLPWTIAFFLDFGNSYPLPNALADSPKVVVEHPTLIDAIEGDPAQPQERQIWLNLHERRLKVFFQGHARIIQFLPESLMAPLITLSDYIDAVLSMLLVFALSFQLPLVVLALARIGILDIPALKKARKYVYFALTVTAAVITPGDLVFATVALMVPLILLYEMGIWLASIGPRPQAV